MGQCRQKRRSLCTCDARRLLFYYVKAFEENCLAYSLGQIFMVSGNSDVFLGMDIFLFQVCINMKPLYTLEGENISVPWVSLFTRSDFLIDGNVQVLLMSWNVCIFCQINLLSCDLRLPKLKTARNIPYQTEHTLLLLTLCMCSFLQSHPTLMCFLRCCTLSSSL